MTINCKSQSSQRLWLSMEISFAASIQPARAMPCSFDLQTFAAGSLTGVTSTSSAEPCWSFSSCCHPYACPLVLLPSLCLSSTIFRRSSCISAGTCGLYKQNAIQPQKQFVFLTPVWYCTGSINFCCTINYSHILFIILFCFISVNIHGGVLLICLYLKFDNLSLSSTMCSK